ncbi:hypothetical protein DSO57_1038397 [Entomophthora muscae]|uniref:Uncharacterized protein n=1 Tax=Entomophthora muscae TaxID=34485 RepID=A0ACC2UJJ3_9FUNG|nr:hypothetical protein DSO57_1038397 [Entomophthora muscae]
MERSALYSVWIENHQQTRSGGNRDTFHNRRKQTPSPDQVGFDTVINEVKPYLGEKLNQGVLDDSRAVVGQEWALVVLALNKGMFSIPISSNSSHNNSTVLVGFLPGSPDGASTSLHGQIIKSTGIIYGKCNILGIVTVSSKLLE